MTTFAAVAREFAAAVKEGAARELSRNHLGAQLVALGFLGGLSRKEINSEARESGQYDDTAWKVAKVALSRAWRAVGSDTGFGEKLARQWAAGDFTVSLVAAYEASAPEAKRPDNLTKVIKLMMTLSAEELEVALKRVEELRVEATRIEANRAQRFDALGLA